MPTDDKPIMDSFFSYLSHVTLLVSRGYGTLLPPVKIGIGYFLRGTCPASPNLSFALFITGFLSLIEFLMIRLIGSRKKVLERVILRGSQGLISIAIFVWSVEAAHLVYLSYEPNYADKTLPNYCDPVLYSVAVFITTANFVLGLFITVYFSCVLCRYGFKSACVNTVSILNLNYANEGYFG